MNDELPVKVPVVVVRVFPSVVTPETTGATVETGVVLAITALAVEVPELAPEELVAVTTETIVEPVSVSVRV